ncbi:MAG: hypothetical protein ABR583_06490 [Gaiellaceae bacterium]
MDAVTGYVELGLRLGRHVDGLVDAYYGPPELGERVAAEPLRDPGALAADARLLADALAEDPVDLAGTRRRWLHAQVIGLQTVAERLAGVELPYEDEVERCYGVRPRHVSEADFDAAHAELEELLPGDGSLPERYQAWREGDSIPADLLPTVVERVAAELRVRTARTFGLPDGEEATFDYVAAEPWSAYNYYLGKLRSRIAVNTDLPTAKNFVTDLVAHETYPGHHTEHAWKEHLLLARAGQLEASILMIGTPESLVSEGIAMLGPELLLGEELERLAAEQLGAAGLDYNPELAAAVKRARRPIELVPGNAALMLHSDGATRDDALAYVRRWGLASEARAEQTVRFVSHPVWRSYIATYTDGYRVCSEFVRGEPARFRRLLTEQLAPADLIATS